VKIKLLQHTGEPAKPLVRRGEKVKRDALIADVQPSKLGANIHASIDGVVKAVSETLIEIEAEA
jgi:Na+-translocating ferredoxin:NAD+ oxidoreductase RnfC subunit